MTASYTLVLILLLLFSSFFSAAETAFSALNKTRIKTLAEQGNPRARLSLSLSERYDRLLSTILIGNNIVNIAAASLGTVLFVGLLGDIGATVSTVVLTIAVLIFGEITPKSIAKECPERSAMAVAPAMALFLRLLSPLSLLFSAWQNFLSRLLQFKKDNKMSQEELFTLVDEVEHQGSIDADTGMLLRNALSFSDRTAEDILTHRTELEAVSADADSKMLAEIFSRSRYSRIPVYEGSIDNILGVIHQKDFYTAEGISTKSLRELVSPVPFVFKSEGICQLLYLLQKAHTHVAVILDEYGGTYGIVTLEDILEELVGEIYDEYDEISEPVTQLAPGLYQVSGSMHPQDFCTLFSIKSTTGTLSLSAWLSEILGHPPTSGETVQYQNLSITVGTILCHRVQNLRVWSGSGLPSSDSP